MPVNHNQANKEEVEVLERYRTISQLFDTKLKFKLASSRVLSRDFMNFMRVQNLKNSREYNAKRTESCSKITYGNHNERRESQGCKEATRRSARKTQSVENKVQLFG